MNRKQSIASLSVLVFVLACMLASAFLSGGRDFSENENRVLQTAPALSAKKIMSGKYQSELENCLSDQFFARDVFTAGTTVVKKLAGYKDVGGAYLGADGYYLEIHTAEDFDMAGLRDNLGYIGELCDKNPSLHTSVVLVPCAACVNRDKLPAFASCYDPKAVYSAARETLGDKASAPEIFSALQQQGNADYYYKTDHHWTAFGALTAYRALSDGVGAYNAEPELFCGGFFGTTYSKTLDPAATPDDVYIFPLRDSVKAEADGNPIPVYDTQASARKDKYTVYLGGNHGLTVLSGGEKNGKTLLIIKDSFANCLAPLFTADYETVVMLDPRYFAGSTQSVIGEYRPDDLMFVFEMSSIAETRDLVKIIM